MTDGTWLNRDHEMPPGAELFRSDRRFFLEAYSASHGQLLLRSMEGEDALGRHHDTTIEILFKPVDALSIEAFLHGVTIRRATDDETSEIKGSLAGVSGDDVRVFLIDSRDTTGYVIARAVGWREGVLGRTLPSLFNGPSRYTPRWPHQPLFGLNTGLSEASAEELVQALRSPADERRERFRFVHVLMTRAAEGDGAKVAGSGVFLTREDAEEARAVLAAEIPDCWIEDLPVVL
ncbi:hypothetical protein [Actinomadura harenae]|nr:hypothetical protein [Actinomadura harenae]